MRGTSMGIKKMAVKTAIDAKKVIDPTSVKLDPKNARTKERIVAPIPTAKQKGKNRIDDNPDAA
jgi:hypothetical protein